MLVFLVVVVMGLQSLRRDGDEVGWEGLLGGGGVGEGELGLVLGGYSLL